MQKVAFPVRLGIAGWSIPKSAAGWFPAGGSHLERYAQRLPAVEINSSFYRNHQVGTYQRWAASTPPEFCVAVKLPRQITHQSRLAEPALLDGFLPGPLALGAKLGPLLVQLPPSLRFSATLAEAFFGALRLRFAGLVACEPRHASWFTRQADQLLAEHQVARVAADPARAPLGGEPGGWKGLVYYRLHGSPRVYYSSYSEESLVTLAESLLQWSQAAHTWCIFDNTAEGAAFENARRLAQALGMKAMTDDLGRK